MSEDPGKYSCSASEPSVLKDMAKMGRLDKITILNPTDKTVYFRFSSDPNALMTTAAGINAGMDGAGFNFKKETKIQMDGEDMIHSGGRTAIIPTTKMTKITFSSNSSFPPLPFSWAKLVPDGSTYTIPQAKVDGSQTTYTIPQAKVDGSSSLAFSRSLADISQDV
jgi:hypothetical protein